MIRQLEEDEQTEEQQRDVGHVPAGDHVNGDYCGEGRK